MDRLSLEGIAGFSVLWLILSLLVAAAILKLVLASYLPDNFQAITVIVVAIGSFAPPITLIGAYCYNQIVSK